jgi:tRNA 2-selenouridine synthase
MMFLRSFNERAPFSLTFVLMIKELSIEDFLEQAGDLSMIDVRSPGEYLKAHIPCAHNIPVFSDEERAHVGTVYVQESKEKAIALGYEYVNPKRDDFIDQVKAVAPQQKVAVHCWRGGMRSRAFAEHLNKNGIETYQIIKGYKSFRNLVVNTFDQDYELRILGGFTGSGKTFILEHLKGMGEQVVDLEGIANHKGSAFGSIGCGKQPSSEQFENVLFWEWRELDKSKPIWLEDESMNIGDINLPKNLFHRMRQSQVYFLDIPREERAKHLVEEYAIAGNAVLAGAIHRISKRLGRPRAEQALNDIENGNYYEVAMNTLTYYDKYYQRGLNSRDEKSVKVIKADSVDHQANAKTIVET